MIAQSRIKEKKANLNCWQFCLLCYLEADQISWKAVGKLYTFLDSVRGEGMCVPDAVKFGKFSMLNFNDEHALPKPGDFVCFSTELGKDCHCAIFQNYDAASDSFSFIEINCMGSVTIKKNSAKLYLDNYSITFVSSEHVEDNILNFLNYYRD